MKNENTDNLITENKLMLLDYLKENGINRELVDFFYKNKEIPFRSILEEFKRLNMGKT